MKDRTSTPVRAALDLHGSKNITSPASSPKHSRHPSGSASIPRGVSPGRNASPARGVSPARDINAAATPTFGFRPAPLHVSIGKLQIKRAFSGASPTASPKTDESKTKAGSRPAPAHPAPSQMRRALSGSSAAASPKVDEKKTKAGSPSSPTATASPAHASMSRPSLLSLQLTASLKNLPPLPAPALTPAGPLTALQHSASAITPASLPRHFNLCTESAPLVLFHTDPKRIDNPFDYKELTTTIIDEAKLLTPMSAASALSGKLADIATSRRCAEEHMIAEIAKMRARSIKIHVDDAFAHFSYLPPKKVADHDKIADPKSGDILSPKHEYLFAFSESLQEFAIQNLTESDFENINITYHRFPEGRAATKQFNENKLRPTETKALDAFRQKRFKSNFTCIYLADAILEATQKKICLVSISGCYNSGTNEKYYRDIYKVALRRYIESRLLSHGYDYVYMCADVSDSFHAVHTRVSEAICGPAFIAAIQSIHEAQNTKNQKRDELAKAGMKTKFEPKSAATPASAPKFAAAPAPNLGTQCISCQARKPVNLLFLGIHMHMKMNITYFSPPRNPVGMQHLIDLSTPPPASAAVAAPSRSASLGATVSNPAPIAQVVRSQA